MGSYFLKNQDYRKNLQGLTLVELSIVIVIVGMIIAGIASGKNLIDTARLRAQILELQSYNSAFNSFVTQYEAIPGDMKNAPAIWPGATAGNGVGKLNFNEDGPLVSNTILFQHLSRAKFISGSYNGTWAINWGYPSLKLNSNYGMIAAGYLNPTNAGVNQLSAAAIQIQHIAALYLNVVKPSASDSTFNDSLGVMNPKQAYLMDAKIDDGLARRGKFKAYTPFTPITSTVGNCLTGTDGDYLKTNTRAACDVEYKLK